MEISFIIPVYNGEMCIGKCIREIQKWALPEEIEIIIVNDGSTDHTGSICDTAANRDDRIHVLHIENSGQGIARNRGIEAAKGKYLYFADADDWVNIKEVYKLWNKANAVRADVIMGSYFRIGKQIEWVHMPEEGFIKKKGTLKEVKRYHRIKTESAFGYVWNKLYRREFLVAHDLWLDDIRGMNMEDFLFNLKVWSKEPVFYCTDYPVYNYVTENTSTTRKADPNIHKKSISMITELICYLKKNGVLEENMDMVIPLIMRSFSWSLIKNIAYEGKMLKLMISRAKAFTENGEIQEALKWPGASRYLNFLPSFLQRIFYFLCLQGMKYGAVHLICIVFYITYPLLKRYVASALK